VIDCHDRELIGWEFALRGRAKEAERAIEEACIKRFGTLRPTGMAPIIRSDNGLVFQSRRFRAACRDYRLSQEFITPEPGANALSDKRCERKRKLLADRSKSKQQEEDRTKR
jgi:putative transposase